MADHAFKDGDLVDFSVVRRDDVGTYHGAVYINGVLALIGEGRQTYEEARADASAEEKRFRQAVKFEDVGEVRRDASHMVH